MRRAQRIVPIRNAPLSKDDSTNSPLIFKNSYSPSRELFKPDPCSLARRCERPVLSAPRLVGVRFFRSFIERAFYIRVHWVSAHRYAACAYCIPACVAPHGALVCTYLFQFSDVCRFPGKRVRAETRMNGGFICRGTAMPIYTCAREDLKRDFLRDKNFLKNQTNFL